jgi:hypothetical protein
MEAYEFCAFRAKSAVGSTPDPPEHFERPVDDTWEIKEDTVSIQLSGSQVRVTPSHSGVSRPGESAYGTGGGAIEAAIPPTVMEDSESPVGGVRSPGPAVAFPAGAAVIGGIGSFGPPPRPRGMPFAMRPTAFLMSRDALSRSDSSGRPITSATEGSSGMPVTNGTVQTPTSLETPPNESSSL